MQQPGAIPTGHQRGGSEHPLLQHVVPVVVVCTDYGFKLARLLRGASCLAPFSIPSELMFAGVVGLAVRTVTAHRGIGWDTPDRAIHAENTSQV